MRNSSNTDEVIKTVLNFLIFFLRENCTRTKSAKAQKAQKGQKTQKHEKHKKHKKHKTQISE